MFYSASTNGFYSREIHGDGIPDDSVEITLDEHADLLSGQSSGKKIVPDAYGRPILSDPQPDNAHTVKRARACRLAAYRAESDPIKIEADYDALISGTDPDYEKWVEAVESIKSRYPMPIL